MYFCSLAAAALLSTVYSAAVPPPLGLRDSGITVALACQGNSQVKVTVINNADHAISLLNPNSFFDSSPIQKVNVYKAGFDEEIPFHGIQPRYDLEHLTSDSFTVLAPGARIDSEFDLAETLDLSSGGDYTISAQGVFLIGSNSSISGVAPYKSNTIKARISAAAIAARSSSPLLNLTLNALEEDTDTCSNTPQGAALQAALKAASILSTFASKAARSGAPGRFHEYFRTTDRGTRQSVSSRFAAIAQFLSSKTREIKVTYHCTDPPSLNHCRDGILAYAIPSRNIIVNCPGYYNLPPLTDRCHGQDMATTTLHELTHVGGVYAPSTVDHAYGYDGVVALEGWEARGNADSFSLFANAVLLGC